MSPSMCLLRNVTASLAEGKERSGDSSSSPGHWNVPAPDDCAGTEGVERCVENRFGAVDGAHAPRVTPTKTARMATFERRSQRFRGEGLVPTGLMPLLILTTYKTQPRPAGKGKMYAAVA
jgi:hypothetical protein